MDYLPYFIFAFDELFRRGIGLAPKRDDRKRARCHLEAVYNRHDHEETQVFYGEKKILTDESQPIHFSSLMGENDASITRVRLSFLTPTAIKKQGDFLKELSFHSFIQNLMGRISMLALFHCDSSLELDFASLLERAETISVENDSLSWQNWLRYSGKQKRRMNWGGVVGELDFACPRTQGRISELSEFMPYIRLGEYIHVGKSTAFGLGQYEIKKVEF